MSVVPGLRFKVFPGLRPRLTLGTIVLICGLSKAEPSQATVEVPQQFSPPIHIAAAVNLDGIWIMGVVVADPKLGQIVRFPVQIRDQGTTIVMESLLDGESQTMRRVGNQIEFRNQRTGERAMAQISADGNRIVFAVPGGEQPITLVFVRVGSAGCPDRRELEQTTAGCEISTSSAPAPPAAGTSPASDLNAALQQAVDQQNWDRAIQIVDRMIVIYPDRAAELRNYRQRLEQLRESQR